MKISPENKKKIIYEIDFILKSMRESKEDKNPIKYVYYFSGINAVLYRVFNFEYDPDLVFAHIILKITHDTFRQKIADGDPIIDLSDEHLEKLYSLSETFREVIINNDISFLYKILRDYVVLFYSIGGNGYYLAQKGDLKI